MCLLVDWCTTVLFKLSSIFAICSDMVPRPCDLFGSYLALTFPVWLRRCSSRTSEESFSICVITFLFLHFPIHMLCLFLLLPPSPPPFPLPYHHLAPLSSFPVILSFVIFFLRLFLSPPIFLVLYFFFPFYFSIFSFLSYLQHPLRHPVLPSPWAIICLSSSNLYLIPLKHCLWW